MINYQFLLRSSHNGIIYGSKIVDMKKSDYGKCTRDIIGSRVGFMVSTQVRQSEGSGFKSRSGQIAYFHGVKTSLSTLGSGDVPHGSDST